MVLTQLYLVASGNYAWLNWVTIFVVAAALPDALLRPILPRIGPAAGVAPVWFTSVIVGMALLVVVLSYWPVRNLLGRQQLMNASFNQLHIVNTYGAFGSVTRHRDEVVIEGTVDDGPSADASWREYEFQGKPGDLRRRPPQVAPYHLRLDWLMWFLPLSPGYGDVWFIRFVERLLRNDPATLGLLRANPFPDRPPARIRARLYRYRFTTWREWRATGNLWERDLVGEYLPAVGLRGDAQPWTAYAAGNR
jgi:hypothetical protein